MSLASIASNLPCIEVVGTCPCFGPLVANSRRILPCHRQKMVSIVVVTYPSYWDPSSIGQASCTLVVKIIKKGLLGITCQACVASLESVSVGSIDFPIN